MKGGKLQSKVGVPKVAALLWEQRGPRNFHLTCLVRTFWMEVDFGGIN